MQLASPPLLTVEAIQNRVRQLGHNISRDYEGKSLVVISVLKGAFVFTADLIRELKVPLKVEFIGVSSYQGTRSTGHVRITSDLSYDIAGQHVLLVEDIIDSGKTIDYLLDVLRVRKPASLQICSFLSKPACHSMKNEIAYVGFEIPDHFVVGYGLDFNGAYRELPHLSQLLPS